MEELLNKDAWDTLNYEDVCLYTIIQTFYEAGLRVSELTGLNHSSVDFSSNSIKVLGKGNKHRIVPFGDGLRKSLQQYIEIRNKAVEDKDRAFFKTPEGCRIPYDWLRYRISKKLTTVCTLKKKSPHVLRHTFATAMLNHDAGIENVSKLLGHTSLSTTEIYAHTTFEQLKRQYKKAHPRSL